MNLGNKNNLIFKMIMNLSLQILFTQAIDSMGLLMGVNKNISEDEIQEIKSGIIGKNKYIR